MDDDSQIHNTKHPEPDNEALIERIDIVMQTAIRATWDVLADVVTELRAQRATITELKRSKYKVQEDGASLQSKLKDTITELEQQADIDGLSEMGILAGEIAGQREENRALQGRVKSLREHAVRAWVGQPSGRKINEVLGFTPVEYMDWVKEHRAALEEGE